MKINGPNQTNFNPYKNQMQKQADYKNEVNKKDQIEISSQAKQLQENEKPHVQRASYVQEIKNAVESGEYKVNPERTAEKMIDFWSKK
ncbi:negative regulator of flagellin synthesis FlgM [Virgibacillus natechei]|uniref:Negative regulator of flagellin synthesis n=1 Tax=Virgibacillus natechei TaxID=1216297 RepID=A0ABS4IJN8_9BACI|nr:flagellar biosynthesis anti-sigma factor FlgM [Virgibacillus natechei]MBP1971173.1 negative regulator of flagellin synthesis FlgM [Virgibacillus natechei]UZD11920.1 flagellar biosynthesis anti-sigma factor FlgM [Virgibacillus natechei]